ncbi:MAG: hypothetical protein E4G89_03985, partial [Methanothrix sp.]
MNVIKRRFLPSALLVCVICILAIMTGCRTHPPRISPASKVRTSHVTKPVMEAPASAEKPSKKLAERKPEENKDEGGFWSKLAFWKRPAEKDEKNHRSNASLSKVSVSDKNTQPTANVARHIEPPKVAEAKVSSTSNPDQNIESARTEPPTDPKPSLDALLLAEIVNQESL